MLNKSVIVKKSIRHIIVIDKKLVVILLFICLSTNMFKFLRYIFLFLCTIWIKKLERLKKHNRVPIIPSAIEAIKIILLGASPTFNTIVYAAISAATDSKNINIEAIGFLSFMSSFFFAAFSMSISLYLEIII
ncbi:hypothetical protein SDC9_167083 [bioreactor metagenome]|uniref:Uncharacterized protein n=1 Tax=bioreactor metagenome TaxID=1076179 RepID=A0A645FYT9_9ZZZZ